MANKGKRLNLSDEERKARSERAKRLLAERVIDSETGEERSKFGGRQPPITPKKTSDDLIKSIVDATKGEDVQVAVIQAYITALVDGSRPEKLRAAKGLTDILEGHKKQELAERRELNEERRTAILGGILRDLEQGSEEEEDILDADFSVEDDDGTRRDPAVLRELEAGEGPPD